MMPCPDCGFREEEGSIFCSNCGAAFARPSRGEQTQPPAQALPVQPPQPMEGMPPQAPPPPGQTPYQQGQQPQAYVQAHAQGAYPAQPPEGGRNRWMPWLIGVMGLLVIAVVVLILVFTVFKGDGGGETAVSGSGSTETSGEAGDNNDRDAGRDTGRDTTHDLISYEGMLVPLDLGYPRGWTLAEDPDGYIEIWPKDAEGEVLLFIFNEDLTGYEYSLDDWVDQATTDLEEMGWDFEVSSTEIDGYPASRITYVEDQTDTPDYKVMQIYTIKGSMAYSVKFIAEETAYERYLEEATKVIESIELL